jgi:hypothetical protein
VSFRYTGGGGERTVWIANAFSEAFRLDLARRYQLAGVSVQDISTASSNANLLEILTAYSESGDVQLVTPNGSLLQPFWTASSGSIDNASSPAIAWQAPADAGIHTLTLTVSDGLTRAGQAVEVAVEEPATTP